MIAFYLLRRRLACVVMLLALICILHSDKLMTYYFLVRYLCEIRQKEYLYMAYAYLNTVHMLSDMVLYSVPTLFMT